MYRLHRIMLNSRGEGVSSSAHQSYETLPDAVEQGTARATKDNMGARVKWVAVDVRTSQTVFDSSRIIERA
jgi:hypothetical protein